MLQLVETITDSLKEIRCQVRIISFSLNKKDHPLGGKNNNVLAFQVAFILIQNHTYSKKSKEK